MKKLIGSLISAILVVALGVFVLLRPLMFMKIVVVLFGSYTAIEGLGSFFSILRRKLFDGYFMVTAIKALINLAIGAVVVYFAITVPGFKVVSWVVYLIAIDLVFSAIVNIVDMVMLRKIGLGYSLIGSGVLFSLLFALLLFIFPAIIGTTAMTVIGIVLILFGCMMGFTSLWTYHHMKELKKTATSQTVEGQFKVEQ